MHTATVKQLKTELENCSPKQLLEYCLVLSKFKKENKELLTYLIFESEDEEGFINGVKLEVEDAFGEINTSSYYYVKKSVRKILRMIKKYIRYSKKKETEIELLIHFCQQVKSFRTNITRSPTMKKLYDRQILSINKAMESLHEDLQYDYSLELETL
jgi:hypothetical protein